MAQIKIDISEVNLTITENAVKEISLIKDNDFTVEGMSFRLKIDGKGCGGFDYACGFTKKNEDDLFYKDPNSDLIILIDPFTAYYCKEGTLDYIKDYQNNSEGFHFENTHEKKYRGKFFKDESMEPEMIG